MTVKLREGIERLSGEQQILGNTLRKWSSHKTRATLEILH